MPCLMGDTKLEPDLQKVRLWVEEIMTMVLAEDKCASSTSAALDEIMPRSVVEETNIMRRTATSGHSESIKIYMVGTKLSSAFKNPNRDSICAFFPHSRVRRTCESDKPLFC
jgi:hypothetical protein